MQMDQVHLTKSGEIQSIYLFRALSSNQTFSSFYFIFQHITENPSSEIGKYENNGEVAVPVFIFFSRLSLCIHSGPRR